jgi:hypothetical protein
VNQLPDTSTLLALGEICATLLGFVGVVLVLGRRSTGEWNEMERARFIALLTGSIGALTLSLIPLVLSDANAFHCAVAISGVSFYLIGREGLRAVRNPEGSTRIAVPVSSGSLLVFLTLGLTDLGLISYDIGTLYLSAILWQIALAGIFFVRLISVTTISTRV